jgi:LysR family nitrogen assimilation transcriptional regulator
LLGTPLPLAELAMRELAIPSQPHAIRMRLETVLAAAGLRPAIGLEIESVPAMLDLVQRQPLHAVLSLNAIVVSGMQARLQARPIVMPPMGNALRGMPLSTTLSVATSAHRPRGPLLEQALPVLRTLLQARLGMAHSSQGPDAEPERRGRPATEDPPAGRTNRPPAQGGPR